MKKRIAVWMPGGVGGGYFSQGIPAISTLVHALAKTHEITVFSLHPANPDFKPQGFRLITARRKSWLWLIIQFLSTKRQNHYDILYAFWGFPAGFIVATLGLIFRTPSIIHLQGGDSVYLRDIRYGVLGNVATKKLALWSYRNCTRLIVLTRFQEDALRKNGYKGSVEVIPFGADRNTFRHHKRSFHSNSNRELRILNIGNVSPVKDHTTLIKTFAEIQREIPARLRLIGQHATSLPIKQLCASLQVQDRVELLESYPNSELPNSYAWADVFLLTSMYEGQGVVLAEAAASGCLVAGTNVGLLNDWGPNNAIVAPIGDYKSLSSEILAVLQDTNRSDEYSKRLHMWSQTHDLKWTFNQIEDLIDNT